VSANARIQLGGERRQILQRIPDGIQFGGVRFACQARHHGATSFDGPDQIATDHQFRHQIIHAAP